MEPNYTPLILVVAVVVVLFVIGREIVCWYWKVNEGLDLLKEIRDLLNAQADPQDSPKAIVPDHKGQWGHLDRFALAGMGEEELLKLTKEMRISFPGLPKRDEMEVEILKVIKGGGK